jgi:hypothetical protein
VAIFYSTHTYVIRNRYAVGLRIGNYEIVSDIFTGTGNNESFTVGTGREGTTKESVRKPPRIARFASSRPSKRVSIKDGD